MTTELDLVSADLTNTGLANADLEAIRHSVAHLLASVASPPSMLRVTAGEVAVELHWGPVTTGHPAAAAPSAEPTPRLVEESYVPEQTVLSGEPLATRGTSIFAPTVGAFYRAATPGAPPFVNVGDIVAAGQQMGIVEAMKFMIPVEADRPGRVTEVLKADAAPVEYGEALFIIEPLAEG